MSKNWGGTRPGAGRVRQNIKLDLPTARLVAEKLKQWQQERKTPELTEDDVACELIQQAARTEKQEG